MCAYTHSGSEREESEEEEEKEEDWRDTTRRLADMNRMSG